jgi:hypothetical protein
VATRTRFLIVAGRLQNQDGVVHVKAQSFTPLYGPTTGPDQARNFH